ncbi:uncharacterized protein LOC112569024 [Pomacea canaliculata]|uniref:uncharacterized protein LOC112569024 n=1 Tax=Pomacea canaliculata TaxID=400727 RepID=UPI000D7294E0|nr:uncharacterized protein LOC112569024 [Pomacea canaliculata]
MEFTFTKRNNRKLLHEGYAYVMDRTKADNVTIFWRCEKRGECKGRLKTVNDVLEGRPSTHSHPPSVALTTSSRRFNSSWIRWMPTLTRRFQTSSPTLKVHGWALCSEDAVVAMWNVYNRVGDNLPRTNNSVEGWHRAFDKRMSVTHPTLGRLVSKLRKEQASTELMMEQLAMGVRMRKNKQYEKVNTRLQALVARYAQEDVLDFLKAVAHNL